MVVGVASHDENVQNSKTLGDALTSAHGQRTKSIWLAVVDRGYHGAKQHVDAQMLLPGPAAPVQ